LASLIFEIGFGLTIAGILVAFAAVILLLVSGKKGDSRVRGGGILLVGPIPIIFGTDRQSVKVLILVAIASIVIMALLAILPYWLK
jgi:uncharacterized protein (TIGR00304 family)